jgi:hypothetical protein
METGQQKHRDEDDSCGRRAKCAAFVAASETACPVATTNLSPKASLFAFDLYLYIWSGLVEFTMAGAKDSFGVASIVATSSHHSQDRRRFRSREAWTMRLSLCDGLVGGYLV